MSLRIVLVFLCLSCLHLQCWCMKGDRKLTVTKASLFVAGDVAGTGVLVLPKAVEGTGWIGLVLIVVLGVISAYTGYLIGTCWCQALEHDPGLREQDRIPYPTIGEAAYGKSGKILVTIALNLTLLGYDVVLSLLVAQNFQLLAQFVSLDLSICIWLIVVTGIIVPLSWLGTPKDFWYVGVGAVLTTSISCVILLSNMLKDATTILCVQHKPPDFLSFASALGTIALTFGGHPVFPTIQADMRDERKFGTVVSVAYLVVLAMYFPVTTAGYFIYGDLLADNLLKTVSTGPMQYIAEIVITLHLICAFIIVLNPLSQEVEALLRVPKEIGWKRLVVRTSVVAVILFAAQSVQNVGAILSLIGGSSSALLVFVFPPLFYLKLCQLNDNNVPLHIKVANYEIVFVGLVAGAASTYSAIAGLAQPGAFTVPCYINVTAALG